MNIYVETNFVLEIAFEQEQCDSCEQILQLCEAEQNYRIIPAYSLGEAYETLHRQAGKRRALQESLDAELSCSLSRTASYADGINGGIQDVADLIVARYWSRARTI